MYPYTDVNLFDKPNKYMYTPFYGFDFIYSYFENRRQAIIYLKSQPVASVQIENKIQCKTHTDLQQILKFIDKGDYQLAYFELEAYVRRFEVAKRLRNEYPVKDSSDISSIGTHLLFFNILIKAYLLNNDVRYLNVLLKLSDSLISIKELVKVRRDVDFLVYFLEEEMVIVNRLMCEMKVEI